MGNPNDTLPEGTDSIVSGAGRTENEDSLIMSTDSTSGRGGRRDTDSTGGLGGNTTTGAAGVSGTTGGTAGASAGGSSGTTSARARAVESLRSGTDKLSGQAADKARGLVGQGLERGGEALSNVSKLIGDTATGLDERLGSQYGDYARQAATTIEDTANRLAAKDPDELIEDTREFVRKSPGVALAGAAILGFALVRLVKSGLEQPQDRGDSKSRNS